MSTYLKHVENINFHARKNCDISFDSPLKKLVYNEILNPVSITTFGKLKFFV